MWSRVLVVGGGLGVAFIAIASCDSEPGVTPAPSEAPGAVCGNAIREEDEPCDPYSPPSTWSCPSCRSDCTCGSDEEGGGGAGGGSGGEGGFGAGLPVGGDGSLDCDPPTGTAGALKLTPIAYGLKKPLLAIAPHGEANRLYIIEQEGRIKIYEDGETKVFLDITGIVLAGGERGLLGLAFHPDYAENGRFFVHYSLDPDGATAISEYRRDPDDHDRALPMPVGGGPFFTEAQPAANHNGGAIMISPVDGHLYVALGDGGGGGDTYHNGQNFASRLGKILRIDIETSPPSAAGDYPGANPFVWDVGMRNPYRSSFDACTGDLYIGEVGQHVIEEIDVEPAGMGHRNYGWNTMEGSACFSPSKDCDVTGLTVPLSEYTHQNGCAVVGGYVYRGSAIPWLRGTYFYGDYCSGRIWTFVWDGSAATNLTERTGDLESTNLAISSFGQDASGEIYITRLSDGALYRIEAE